MGNAFMEHAIGVEMKNISQNALATPVIPTNQQPVGTGAPAMAPVAPVAPTAPTAPTAPLKVASRPANVFTIMRVSEASNYIKMFVYGASGVGKTHFAATANKCEPLRDVLYLDAESGSSTLVNMGCTDIDVVPIRNWSGLVGVFDFLYAYCKLRDGGADDATMRKFLQQYGLGDRKVLPVYRTVVLDTLDEMQDYCMKHIQGIDPQNTRLGAAYSKPGWAEYGEALDRMKAVVRNFRNLPMHVVMTCHQENKQDDNQRMYIAPLLVGKFATAVQAYFDFVAFYAARTIRTKDGTAVERRMYIEPGVNFDAKNRCNAARGWIDEPTMSKILELMQQSGK